MKGVVLSGGRGLPTDDPDQSPANHGLSLLGRGDIRDRSGELDRELQFKLVRRAADAGHGESGQFRQSKYLPSTLSGRDGFCY